MALLFRVHRQQARFLYLCVCARWEAQAPLTLSLCFDEIIMIYYIYVLLVHFQLEYNLPLSLHVEDHIIHYLCCQRAEVEICALFEN